MKANITYERTTMGHQVYYSAWLVAPNAGERVRLARFGRHGYNDGSTAWLPTNRDGSLDYSKASRRICLDTLADVRGHVEALLIEAHKAQSVAFGNSVISEPFEVKS